MFRFTVISAFKQGSWLRLLHSMSASP